MSRIFNAYFLFRSDSKNPKIWRPVRSSGHYKNFQSLRNKFIKLKVVFSKTAFIYIEKGTKSTPILCSNMENELLGTAHFDVSEDAAIGIFSPQKREIEFFIAEKRKGFSLALLNRFLSGEFENEVSQLRKKP